MTAAILHPAHFSTCAVKRIGVPSLMRWRLAVWFCAACLMGAAGADCTHVFLRAGEDTGAPYLTLRRLAVWVSEPLLRLKTLASLTDALEALPAGKLIAALDAAAQHGDPAVSSTVSDP